MDEMVGSAANPLRVAVVGSGPAGVYAAGQLLAAEDLAVEVDVFDRLATPWGLVRFGVAPDHPKIKMVTRVYEKIASKPGFRLHGNVEVGVDVSHAELADAYHAVLYAVGATSDRLLGIPGEDLVGNHSATTFASWYNGHPDDTDHDFELDARRVVLVGNGNVAFDVARVLALSARELAVTDAPDYAIEALAGSGIEEIVVLARRGPAQASYTSPELKELTGLEEAELVIDAADAVLDDHSRAFVESDAADATVRRNVAMVQEFSARPPGGKRKRIHLRFLVSPVEIVGDGRVEGVRVERNELVLEDDGTIRARPTGETELVEAGMVLRSIGNRARPIPGLPFDEGRATLHNDGGRVTDPTDGEPLPGVYAAGWVKRGATGVIGTNRRCAQETVALLLEDLAARRLVQPPSTPEELLGAIRERGVEVVDYGGWQRIDEHERGLGEPLGRPRVKLVSRADHLLHGAGAQLSRS